MATLRHTFDVIFIPEVEPLIARFRRCIQCEQGRKPARRRQKAKVKAKMAKVLPLKKVA